MIINYNKFVFPTRRATKGAQASRRRHKSSSNTLKTVAARRYVQLKGNISRQSKSAVELASTYIKAVGSDGSGHIWTDVVGQSAEKEYDREIEHTRRGNTVDTSPSFHVPCTATLKPSSHRVLTERRSPSSSMKFSSCDNVNAP